MLHDVEHSQGKRHHEVSRPIVKNFLGNVGVDRIHRAGQGDADRIDRQRDGNGAGQDHEDLIPLQIPEHDDRHRERDEDREHAESTAGIDDTEVHLADNDLIAFPNGIDPQRLDCVGADHRGHRLQRPEQIPRGLVGQGIHEDQEGDRRPCPTKHAPTTPQQHDACQCRHEGVHVDRNDAIAGHEQPQGKACYQQPQAGEVRRDAHRSHRLPPPEQNRQREQRHDPAVGILWVVPGRLCAQQSGPVAEHQQRGKGSHQHQWPPLFRQCEILRQAATAQRDRLPERDVFREHPFHAPSLGRLGIGRPLCSHDGQRHIQGQPSPGTPRVPGSPRSTMDHHNTRREQRFHASGADRRTSAVRNGTCAGLKLPWISSRSPPVWP